MREALDAIERSPDPFGLLSSLRQTQRESFDSLTQDLLTSSSNNPGLWRYLALNFIRSEDYQKAAFAADKHCRLSPENDEAFLRRYRIAVLSDDGPTARRMLEQQRDRLGDFQFECSRFFYLLRFAEGVIPINSHISRLKELGCSEMLRVLIREFGTIAGSAAYSSTNKLPEPQDLGGLLSNNCLFAGMIARLEGVDSLTVVGNGGSLRGAGLGPQIDSQEFVVRINFPKIQGFEADVGARTDMVFFTEAFLASQENLNSLETLRAAYPGVPGLAIDAARRTSVQYNLCSEGLTKQIATVPVEVRSLLRSLSYEFATTGLCAVVMLSILLQKDITLHGFDFYASQKPVHFFSSSSEVFIGHETAVEKFILTSDLCRRGLPAR